MRILFFFEVSRVFLLPTFFEVMPTPARRNVGHIRETIKSGIKQWTSSVHVYQV